MVRSISVRKRIGLILCAFLAACTGEGSVRVVLDTPEGLGLSPLDGRLASVTLLVDGPGGSTRQTRPASDHGPAEPIDLGELEVQDGVRLGLIASGQSGQVLGFGRAGAAIDVAADARTDVRIRVRRPFTYVAGGPHVKVLDATAEPGQAFESWIDPGRATTSVAATPDGADLVVAGATLVLVSTSTHLVRDDVPAVTLSPDALRAAVAPGSRHAVVLHGGATPGLSVVDLAALRAGDGSAVVFVAIPQAGAVSVTDTTAFVLVNATSACAGTSSVRKISLAAPDEPPDPATIALAGTARDVAVDAEGALLALATCAGLELKRVDDDTSVGMAPVPDPTTVAIAGGRAWAFGRVVTPNAAHMAYGWIGLDGSAPMVVDLPATTLSQSFPLEEAPGQAVAYTFTLDSDGIAADDLEVLPEDGRLAVLAHTTYHADRQDVCIDVFCLEQLKVPEADIDTWEYWLVDPTSNVIVQQSRMKCQYQEVAGAPMSCMDDVGEEFQPTRLAVLYGDR